MSQNMKLVKAWKINGKNQLSLCDHEIPSSVPAARLRVEPLYVGTCGSDHDLIKNGGEHSSYKDKVEPIIPGHELCGKVVEIGEGVKGFSVGDIVVVEPTLPCGTCIDCRRGAYNTCKSTRYWATPPQHGCLVQQIDVQPEWTKRVPSGLDPMLACLTEPLAACVEAVWGGSTSRTQMPIDEHVLILGGGNIAMGTALVLLDLINPSRIILAARKQEDLDFAKKLGVGHVIPLGDHRTEGGKEKTRDAMQQILTVSGGGVGSAIECTGASDVLGELIDARVLLGYGRIIGIGCHPKCTVDIPTLRRSAVAYIPVRRSCRKFDRTMNLIKDQPEKARLLVGTVGSFDKLDEVMLKGGGESTGTGGPKTVIRF